LRKLLCGYAKEPLQGKFARLKVRTLFRGLDWSLGLSGNPKAVADKTASLQASAGSLRRLIPKAPPPKYPPKPPFEGAKMPLKKVAEAVGTISQPFAVQYLIDKADKAKNEIELKANENMRKITYPEPLINEAVNRYLSKF